MFEKIYITHYFNNTPPESGLRELDFLTATANSVREKRYFAGYDLFRSISEQEIKVQLQDGSIRRLADTVDGGERRALWMDSNGGIWVADSETPFADKKRRLISKPSLGYVVPEELGGMRMLTATNIYTHRFSGATRARAVIYQKVPRPEDSRVHEDANV